MTEAVGVLTRTRTLVCRLLSKVPDTCRHRDLGTLLRLFLETRKTPLPRRDRLGSTDTLDQFLAICAKSIHRTVHRRLGHCQPQKHQPRLRIVLSVAALRGQNGFGTFSGLVDIFRNGHKIRLIILCQIVNP